MARELKYGSSAIRINEFKLSWIGDNSAILLVAPRRSGKSWIVRAILYEKRHFPVGVFIAPTDKLTRFYDVNHQNLFTYHYYSSHILEKLFMRQIKMQEKKQRKAIEGKNVDTRAILLMDDCLSAKGEWAKDPNIAKMLLEGRHYQIMYILTMQYAIGIGPDLRSNFDYVFLLSDNSVENQEKMRKNFAGIFPNLAAFQEVYFPCTEDHGAVVINNTIKTQDIEKVVFWYRAPNLDRYTRKFFSPLVEKYVKKRYDPNYENRTIKINTIFSKKKKYDLHVNLVTEEESKKEDKKNNDRRSKTLEVYKHRDDRRDADCKDADRKDVKQ